MFAASAVCAGVGTEALAKPGSAWGTDSGIWMFWIFALRCRAVDFLSQGA